MFDKRVIIIKKKTISTLFAERLKYFRNKKGISQVDLAKVIDVERTTISMYETARAVPRISNLVDICNALNITPNDLLISSGKCNEKETD